MTTLYLVRHGETCTNRDKKIPGQYNTHLTQLGKQQARKVGEYLKNYTIQRIIASPLIRTKQTASNIGKLCGLSIQIDSRIIEKNMGRFNGRSRKSVIEEMHLHHTDDRYGILENDSSVEKEYSVFERCKNFLEDLFQQKSGNTVIVSHAGTINVMIHICKNWGKPFTPISYSSLDNCSITKIAYQGSIPNIIETVQY